MGPWKFSIALLAVSVAGKSSEFEVPFAVVGYLPEWRYEGFNWDYNLRTITHLILFSLEPTADGRIVAIDRIPRKLLLDEAKEASKRHDAQLLICFGGNGRSNGFRGMVRSPKSRKRFVKALVALCATHGTTSGLLSVMTAW
jgi:GH18 family chitinase